LQVAADYAAAFTGFEGYMTLSMDPNTKIRLYALKVSN
jgi:hypothetical protein